VSTVREYGDGPADQERAPGGPLTQWHKDHRNFARLLDLVQHQVDAFRASRDPDFELMRLIVHYLRHYPDRFHHPREDIAFSRLVKHDPTLQLAVARRIQEHAVIAAAGDELLKCLDAVIAGAVIERTKLETAAASYLVYYRFHLVTEEQQVIPRALELLTAADWAALAAIPVEPDPLFGTEFDARYQQLREQIASVATRED
jgi:hemerythrin-like domain-containing protein